jgi:hypothetical protein
MLSLQSSFPSGFKFNGRSVSKLEICPYSLEELLMMEFGHDSGIVCLRIFCTQLLHR